MVEPDTTPLWFIWKLQLQSDRSFRGFMMLLQDKIKAILGDGDTEMDLREHHVDLVNNILNSDEIVKLMECTKCDAVLIIRPMYFPSYSGLSGWIFKDSKHRFDDGVMITVTPPKSTNTIHDGVSVIQTKNTCYLAIA